MVVAAIRRFSANTGVGPDGRPPRALCRLALEAAERLAIILQASELLGAWPRGAQLTAIPLIPKPGVQTLRPVRLFPAIIRI